MKFQKHNCCVCVAACVVTNVYTGLVVYKYLYIVCILRIYVWNARINLGKLWGAVE